MSTINNLRRNSVIDQFGIPDINSYTDYGVDDYGIGGDTGENFPGFKQYQQPTDQVGGSYDQAQGGPTPTPINEVRAANQSTGEPTSTFAQYMDTMRGQYHPDTRSTDRLNALLDAVPQMQKPSWGRTLMASGMALKGGPEVAEKVMNAPYYRDMAAWKEKTGPFQSAATQENQGNNIERQLLGTMATGWAADQRQRATDEKNANANEVAMERNRIARLKAATDSDKNRYQIDARSGTTIKVLDKSTGHVTDTGISTRWMTEADKVDAEGRWDVQVSQTAGGQVLQGPNGRPIVVNPRTSPSGVEGLPAGEYTRPGTQSSRAETAADKKIRQATTAQEIVNRDTALAPYIKVVNGVVVAKAPVGGLITSVPGSLKRRYDDAMQQIYGNDPITSQTNILGPETPGSGGGPATDYQVRRNPKNPNEMARTYDGWRTSEHSTDGGHTWSK